MWEESPIGEWTLEVVNDGRTVVELKSWSMAFFGTKEHPQPNLKSVNPAASNVPLPPPHEIDLNQVNSDPQQQVADVTKLHGGKTITDNNPPDTEKSGPVVNNPDAGFHLDHCLDSTSPEWCSVCEAGYLLLNGRCVNSCPAEGYYTGQEHHQETCIQCYYSCKTCQGPNDYQVRGSFASSLFEFH